MQPVLTRAARRACRAVLAVVAAVAAVAATTGPSFAADALVTGFDIADCAATLLPGLEISAPRAVWGVGLRLTATDRAARQMADLTVGVFGSPAEAAERATVFSGDASARFERRSLSEAPVGDAVWSSPFLPGGEQGPAVTVFHRDNVLVRVAGTSRVRVSAVAEELDRALATGAAFVRRDATLERPFLARGTPLPASVRSGESVTIDITPSLPAGRAAYYAYRPAGGSLLGGDPPVPFEYRPHAAGAHALGFVVVDDLCVVSPVLEITLTVETGE